jgi:hypothetical protein
VVNGLSLTNKRLKWGDRLLGVSNTQLALKHKFDVSLGISSRLRTEHIF